MAGGVDCLGTALRILTASAHRILAIEKYRALPHQRPFAARHASQSPCIPARRRTHSRARAAPFLRIARRIAADGHQRRPTSALPLPRATCGRRTAQSPGSPRGTQFDRRACPRRSARLRGAVAQRLAVGLPRSSDVLPGDRRERDKLDGADLDLTGADPVAAALLDPRPLPQPDRESDVSGQNVDAQLAAELHTRDASG